METVKSLTSGLQAFGDVSRYSSTLFDCVDHKQTEIAKYLITNGFKTDIYKQVSLHNFTCYKRLTSTVNVTNREILVISIMVSQLHVYICVTFFKQRNNLVTVRFLKKSSELGLETEKI